MASTKRQKTAQRLLNSSAQRWYDPEVDLDWSAPLDPVKDFHPPHRVSIYGTELWERLTPEQRRELGKQEIAAIASFGIYAEIGLMSMLLKFVTQDSPASPRAQYALTEIADECRHSTMFARAIERVGVPAYGPRRIDHLLGRVLPIIGYGPALYGSILIAEEVLDRLQREAMADENVQPLIRMVNRIHVLEEARHVTFAREEVERGMAKLSRPELAYQRLLLAVVAFKIVRSVINPAVYLAVGLNPKQARRAALANPHHRETIRWAGERIMKFLDEVGLIGGPGRYFWRRSFLLP